MKYNCAVSNCEFLLLSCVFLLFASCRQQASRPPVAAVVPKDTTTHGDKRTDNYFWLRERDEKPVIDYLEAENAYTAKMMQHTEALQEKLFQEMVGRIKETDLQVPEKWGDYYYYTRSEQGKQYQILCRKKDSLTAAEEILLDQNVLAKDKDYFRLGIVRVSPDHKLLAYSVDESGAERYTIYIKNLESDKILADQSRTTTILSNGPTTIERFTTMHWTMRSGLLRCLRTCWEARLKKINWSILKKTMPISFL